MFTHRWFPFPGRQWISEAVMWVADWDIWRSGVAHEGDVEINPSPYFPETSDLYNYLPSGNLT